MNLDLSGRTALVCGASQGIGAATSLELARLGCRVVALARSEDKLNQVVEDLPGEGHRIISCDVNNREELGAKVKSILDEIGTIEVLICNSGGPKGGPLLAAEEDNFLAGFENHVLANMLIIRLLTPGMAKENFGRIINIISTSVKAPIPNLGVSNTIRGAVASMAKTLSVELAPKGITVNNVLPGYTQTPRLDALIEGAAIRLSKTSEEVTSMWKAKVPSERFATAEEVASAAAFLASPAASYINGINLPVDGGRTQSL